MYHRYGRHGPFAWLRWYKRRYRRALPAVIPPVALVPFQRPVDAERILIIVVTPSEPLYPNEPLPFPAEQPRSLQPAPDNSPLARQARIKATDDIDEIQALIKKGTPIIIVDENVEKRAELLAKEEVKRSYPRDNPPDVPVYKDLVGRWKSAYIDQFESERTSIQNLKHFPDTKAFNLAQKARQDREKYTFPSSGRGLFHQRDLAVVSALHELELCQALEEHLEKIHDYVDIYEEAFRNPKKEVSWPGLDSFPS